MPEITRVVQIEPGPIPTFTASAPALIKSRAPSAVATLPAMTSIFHFCFSCLTVSITLDEWPWALSDDEKIDVFFDQAFGPLEIEHASGGPDSQTSLRIFAGLREPSHHVDVFDGNQACQFVIFVNQQKFLDLFAIKIFSASSSVTVP